MDLKSELARIDKELRELETERVMLQNLRKQKMQLIASKIQLAGAKIQNLPERFAAEHPIITEAALGTGQVLKQVGQQVAEEAVPALKKFGKFVYENQLRYNANKAFAQALKPGQTAYNPETGSNVTLNRDGTIRTRRIKKVVMV